MNNYKNALGKLYASEEFKAETIALLSSTRRSEKRRLTAAGAIAASLAVIIGLSAILVLPAKNKSHSFTLTAYAAEATGDEIKGGSLNNKSYVSVGKIKDFGATTTHISRDINGNDVPLNGDTICEAQHSFVFNLNCKGENIDTVTFDSGNGKFNIFKNYKKILSTTGKSYDYNGFSDNVSYYCDSFTTKYNDQIWNIEPVFEPDKLGDQSGSEAYPLLCLETAFHNYEKDEEKPKAVREFYDWYGDSFHHRKDIADKAKAKRLFEAYIDDFVKDLEVTVTAKFKDGIEETKRIKFKSEYLEEDSNGAQFLLKAKLV